MLMDLFPARSGGRGSTRTRGPARAPSASQRCAEVANPVSSATTSLFGGWAEIAQIWRRLAAFGGHQQPLGAQVVGLAADLDMAVAFGADPLAPDRPLPLLANVALLHRPGARQRIVDGGDLVVQQVGLGLVEIDPLLDDRGIVGVQRQPAGIIDARALEAAGLDFQHVVFAVAVLVDPFA